MISYTLERVYSSLLESTSDWEERWEEIYLPSRPTHREARRCTLERPVTDLAEITGLNGAILVLDKVLKEKKLLKIFACDCAETALFLPSFEQQFPNDNRVINAIKVVRDPASIAADIDAATKDAWAFAQAASQAALEKVRSQSGEFNSVFSHALSGLRALQASDNEARNEAIATMVYDPGLVGSEFDDILTAYAALISALWAMRGNTEEAARCARIAALYYELPSDEMYNQRHRLIQYLEHGTDAANMPWPL